ncbi:hypothetical protein [Tenacibaculum ovolyticum]|uniref:hypothetical protein n=1 Tax=Tenacibaculum ovolyticum TaxID=104270 RepID=UPI001F34A4AF|nr:hypothetical protein [Tenacibaculum ovolyticum]
MESIVQTEIKQDADELINVNNVKNITCNTAIDGRDRITPPINQVLHLTMNIH